MILQTTSHGTRYAEFSDTTGCECRIQDGAVATQACVWFGVCRMPDALASPAVRMHLTVEMTRRVARAMRDALEGVPVDAFDFEDRSGNCCVFAAGGDRIRLGVVRSATKGPARAMVLDHVVVRRIMPLLLGFIAQGSIAGDGGVSVLDDLDERRAKQSRIVLPAGMIDRTDVGETGVTAHDLVDAFLEIHRRYGASIGADMGEAASRRMGRMARKLAVLKERRP